VLNLLKDVCANHSGVLRDPAPLVFFNGTGDNGLLFDVWAWTPRIEDSIALRNSLGLDVLAAFKEAGIEAPVPRLEIRMPEGTAAALDLRGPGAPAPPRGPGATPGPAQPAS
jgi:small-conductance mechanosensitive channel